MILIEGRRVRSALEVTDAGQPLPQSLAEQLAANPPSDSETMRVTPEGTNVFVDATPEEWLRWRSVLSLLAPAQRVNEAMSPARSSSQAGRS